MALSSRHIAGNLGTSNTNNHEALFPMCARDTYSAAIVGALGLVRGGSLASRRANTVIEEPVHMRILHPHMMNHSVESNRHARTARTHCARPRIKVPRSTSVCWRKVPEVAARSTRRIVPHRLSSWKEPPAPTHQPSRATFCIRRTQDAIYTCTALGAKHWARGHMDAKGAGRPLWP